MSSPELTADKFIHGNLEAVREDLRSADDPALFVLQVGLCVGILTGKLLNAYHRLRVLLSPNGKKDKET